jgi:hypothetical protein
MIVSELQFLDVEGKPLGGDAMVFHDGILSITPESLHHVDVSMTAGEVFPVVHAKMTVAAEQERIVGLVPVSVDDSAPANLLDGERQYILRPGGGNNFHEDLSRPLQDAEHRDFASGSSCAFLLSLPAEAGLVHLDFPVQEHIAIDLWAGMAGTNRVDGLICRIVGEQMLLDDLPDVEFQFEDFVEAKPRPALRFPWLIQRHENSWKV